MTDNAQTIIAIIKSNKFDSVGLDKIYKLYHVKYIMNNIEVFETTVKDIGNVQ